MIEGVVSKDWSGLVEHRHWQRHVRIALLILLDLSMVGSVSSGSCGVYHKIDINLFLHIGTNVEGGEGWNLLSDCWRN